MKRGNKLGWYMLRRKVTTDALTQKLTDGNATAISLMEQGKALPTRDDLTAICETLGVKKTDIWDEDDLDLLDMLHDGNGSGHGDQVMSRVWMLPNDKRKLLQAIKTLGFKDATAWFRLATEITMKKAAQRAEKRGA